MCPCQDTAHSAHFYKWSTLLETSTQLETGIVQRTPRQRGQPPGWRARGPWDTFGSVGRLKRMLLLRSWRLPSGLEQENLFRGNNKPYHELRILNYEPWHGLYVLTTHADARPAAATPHVTHCVNNNRMAGRQMSCVIKLPLHSALHQRCHRASAQARSLSCPPIPRPRRRESMLFIGTQFSNLYTAVDTPAKGRVGNREDSAPHCGTEGCETGDHGERGSGKYELKSWVTRRWAPHEREVGYESLGEKISTTFNQVVLKIHCWKDTNKLKPQTTYEPEVVVWTPSTHGQKHVILLCYRDSNIKIYLVAILFQHLLPFD
jgi:hypothetical protein